MKCLPYVFEKLTVFVPDAKEDVKILVGLHPCTGQLLMARSPSPFGVAVLIPRQGLPSRLSVSHSVLRPLVFDLVEDVVNKTVCSKKKNALEALIR